MQASDEGYWDWLVATDEFYASPRMLEIYRPPADTVYAGADEVLKKPLLARELALSLARIFAAPVAARV
jgi:hypothetical protein